MRLANGKRSSLVAPLRPLIKKAWWLGLRRTCPSIRRTEAWYTLHVRHRRAAASRRSAATSSMAVWCALASLKWTAKLLRASSSSLGKTDVMVHLDQSRSVTRPGSRRLHARLLLFASSTAHDTARATPLLPLPFRVAWAESPRRPGFECRSELDRAASELGPGRRGGYV